MGSNTEGTFSKQEPPPKQEGSCSKDALRGTDSSDLPLWALGCNSAVQCSTMKQEHTHGNSTANSEVMLTPRGLVWSDVIIILYTARISQEIAWKLCWALTVGKAQVQIPVTIPAVMERGWRAFTGGCKRFSDIPEQVASSGPTWGWGHYPCNVRF